MLLSGQWPKLGMAVPAQVAGRCVQSLGVLWGSATGGGLCREAPAIRAAFSRASGSVRVVRADTDGGWCSAGSDCWYCWYCRYYWYYWHSWYCWHCRLLVLPGQSAGFGRGGRSKIEPDETGSWWAVSELNPFAECRLMVRASRHADGWLLCTFD